MPVACSLAVSGLGAIMSSYNPFQNKICLLYFISLPSFFIFYGQFSEEQQPGRGMSETIFRPTFSLPLVLHKKANQ